MVSHFADTDTLKSKQIKITAHILSDLVSSELNMILIIQATVVKLHNIKPWHALNLGYCLMSKKSRKKIRKHNFDTHILYTHSDLKSIQISITG